MVTNFNFKENPYVPAKKEQAKLKMALVGPSGSGKTWTALEIACALAEQEGGKVAFLDTEGRSARKYANYFTFDVLDIADNYNPETFVGAIGAAARYQYSVLVIDSLTHPWAGAGGTLEIADKGADTKGNNTWAGWSVARPKQNALVTAIVNTDIHLICTMRAKTEWMLVTNEKGKTQPVKIGTTSIQSSEMEYEFDLVLYLDMEHALNVSKSRCHAIKVEKPVESASVLASTLHEWLHDGEPMLWSENPVYQSRLVKVLGETRLKAKDVLNFIAPDARRWSDVAKVMSWPEVENAIYGLVDTIDETGEGNFGAPGDDEPDAEPAVPTPPPSPANTSGHNGSGRAYDLKKVYDNTGWLYEAKAHQQASINKLITAGREGKPHGIADKDEQWLAEAKVLMHAAAKLFEMNDETETGIAGTKKLVLDALRVIYEIEVDSYSAYLRRKDASPQKAWKACQEFAELSKLPPPQPKSKGSKKDNAPQPTPPPWDDTEERVTDIPF